MKHLRDDPALRFVVHAFAAVLDAHAHFVRTGDQLHGDRLAGRRVLAGVRDHVAERLAELVGIHENLGVADLAFQRQVSGLGAGEDERVKFEAGDVATGRRLVHVIGHGVWYAPPAQPRKALTTFRYPPLTAA